MFDRIRRTSVFVATGVMVAITGPAWGQTARPENGEKQGRPIRGSVLFEFDRAALNSLGWEIVVRGEGDSEDGSSRLSSAIQSTSSLEIDLVGGVFNDISTATIVTYGAVLLTDGGRRVVIGNFSIAMNAGGTWTVRDGLTENPTGRVVFELSSVTIDAPAGRQAARIAGELTIAESWAAEQGIPRAGGTVVGRVLITTQPLDAERTGLEVSPPVLSPTDLVSNAADATVSGPDVIVGDLHQVLSFGSLGGISAFAVGTTSCNIGDVWLNWFSTTNQHPVIGQSMYRLKNDRFEHIGQSWLKHGFFALSERLCFSDCQSTDGSHLGVHCSDPYSANLNGTQTNLGPKYQVDAHLGSFTYPPASPSYTGIIARRLQVKNSDLDPALNGGGLYFAEGQYVTPDDAAAGHQNNNASYRRITVSGAGSSWTIALAGTTQREQSAIRAWKDTDPSSVTETDVQVSGDGLFIVSVKATDLGTGYWHYEYAVQNLNSHRSAKAFSIPVDPAGKILNVGFHDVDYHSGEPFSGTDWTSAVASGSITWTTLDYSVNPNANALRWGTLYNFRFDANRKPVTTTATLTLFRPGTPPDVAVNTVGPAITPPDCNGNGVPDDLDILNGTSQDCNLDGVPDECEGSTPSTVQVATGLTQPLYVTSPPGDLNRLFIVEQGGRVKILTGGSVLPTPFLDISSLVSTDVEQGLLSIAFHPNYSVNGRFFVNYTNLAGDTVLAQYSVSGNPNVADANSAVILETIPQTAANHNGGQLQFGPDGFLYVGMGDGGGQFDPLNQAQDTGTLLGKMLRLDVDSPPGYIPATNPYSGPGLPLDEIWAMGLRNPWRFSFDRETGDLYIADVGEDTREEIDFQAANSPGGENYGWRCMEASSCTGLSGCTCDSPTLTPPIVEYPHLGGDCSVTGGYVYRGCALPNLLGTYFYADFCSGAIRSFRYVGGAVTDPQNRTAQLTPPQGPITSIASFGEDAAGELYIVSHDGGIYKIVPQTSAGPVCGNGIVEVGEQCDDGNTVSGDGCDANCQTENVPHNDHCANAQAIGDGAFAFNTDGADTDGPIESAACNAGVLPVGSDIWYCYTPRCTGTATASLCGSPFDTMLAVYNGCTCPTVPSAMDCNDDTCGLQSQISFATTACHPYLIRVGGYEGAQGAGSLATSCQPNPIVNDCNTNGIDDATDIACGTTLDNNGNGIPDICEVNGDYIRGGRLYDKWWAAIGAAEPTTDHPLWPYRPDPTSNPATGSATWRCTECHGWDYKGVDGEYATGPHRTGITGVYGTSLAPAAIITLLKEPPDNGGGPGVPNGHAYGTVLTDGQIDDLVAFMFGGVIDTDLYVNSSRGVFQGDPDAGQIHYTTGGTLNQCINCHGANGTAINFGTPQEPEYLGTVATHEPFHFLHRGRMGFPGTPMPGFLANGGTNQGVADIGRYAQLNFPVDCIDDGQCDDGIACTEDVCDAGGRCVFVPNDGLCPDDGVFCNGAQVCNDVSGCVAAGNPCSNVQACDEAGANCGCATPTVEAAGPRYLAITLTQTGPLIPTRLLVTPNCPLGAAKYVGVPDGTYNVAVLVTNPNAAAVLTPGQWGGTVYVSGTGIAPEVEYQVQADCGLAGRPVLTEAASVQTAKWGDLIGWLPQGGYTPPDGVVDVIDIAALIDTFKGIVGSLPMYAVDMFGCIPNQIIDAIDIVGEVDAFKGLSYPRSACAGPCW
jgi:cysteine-rich repeat protein